VILVHSTCCFALRSEGCLVVGLRLEIDLFLSQVFLFHSHIKLRSVFICQKVERKTQDLKCLFPPCAWASPMDPLVLSCPRAPSQTHYSGSLSVIVFARTRRVHLSGISLLVKFFFSPKFLCCVSRIEP
jgi:hypothetical protein